MSTFPVVIDSVTRSFLETDLATQFSRKDFRPTVVAIIADRQGHILLVRSKKHGNLWGFVQGGVKREEDTICALWREVREEVGITVSQYQIRSLCGVDQLCIPGRSRNGFTTGKCYYYFHLVCSERPKVKLQKKELDKFEWAPPHEVEGFLNAVSAEKRNSLLTALGCASSVSH